MYPGTWARTTPDKPALVIAETGQATTYAELYPFLTDRKASW